MIGGNEGVSESHPLSRPTPMILHDRSGNVVKKFYCEEGVPQGDVLSPFVYSLAVQPLYEKALKEVAADKAHGFAIADDFTVVGDWQSATRVFDRYREECGKEGLKLRCDKSKVLWPHSAPAPLELKGWCSDRKLCVEIGAMEVLGAPIGLDGEKIKCALQSAADRHQTFFERISTNEYIDAQTAVLLLRCCGLPRMNYLVRTVRSDFGQMGFKGAFDSHIRRAFERRTGIEIGARAIANEMLDTFQRPIRHGGLGFRSYQLNAGIPWMCSVAENVVRMPAFLRTQFLNGVAAVSDVGNENCTLVQSFVRRYNQVTGVLGEDAAELLKDTPSAFLEWIIQRVEAKKKEGDDSPEGMQHDVISAVEDRSEKEFVKMLSDSGRKEDLVRHRSITGRNASRWLTVIPSEPSYRLTDHQALNVRLNKPFIGLNHRDRCACGHAFNHSSRDTHHSLCCNSVSKKSLFTRHEHVLTALTAVARSANVTVTRNEQRSDLTGDKRQPDLTLNELRLYTDVCVTHPLRASNTNRAKALSSTGVAAEERATEKTNKYKALVTGAMKFTPFVFETYGTAHEGVGKMIALLAKRAAEEGIDDRSAFARDAWDRIPISLQAGNVRALDIAAGMAVTNSARVRVRSDSGA